MTPPNITPDGDEGELQEKISQLVDRAKGYGYPMTTIQAVNDIMSLISAHTKAKVQEAKKREVRTLLELRSYYDRLELDDTKDFKGNKIATWSGYKYFRNPISDRLEGITGFRSDQEIENWLVQPLKEES